MSVTYEWDVEVVASVESENYFKGDVIEHLHQITFRDCVIESRKPSDKGMEYLICLVRDDDKGRAWSYFIDGKLQPFEDANGCKVCEVPMRYVEEVRRGNY